MAKNEEASLLLKIKTIGQEALSKITFTFGDLVNVVKSVANAMVAPIMAFKEAEQTSKQLTQAMVNAGVYTTKLKDEYIAQADALSQVTQFEDDAIVKAQAVAQQYLKNTAISKDLTMAILNYAQAEGIDASAAAEKVAKTIGTKTNALARDGVQLSDNMNKSQRMTAVLDQLNQRYAGQAEAAGSGLGVLTKLSNAWGNVVETIGEKLSPTLQIIATDIFNIVTKGGAFTDFANVVGQAFNFITKLGYSVAFGFERLGATIGGTIGTVAGSIMQFVSGNFSQAKLTLIQGFDEIGKERERITAAYNAKVAALDEASLKTKEINLDNEKKLEAQARANSKAIAVQERQQDRIDQFAFDQETFQLRMAIDQANHESAMLQMEMNENAKLIAEEKAYQARLQALIAFNQARLKDAKTNDEKLAIQDSVAKLQEQMRESKQREFEAEQAKQKQQMQGETFAKIATMSNSNNKALAAIGKTAALTQIAIDGPMAVTKALAAFPPPFNFAAAGAVGAAVAAQAAQVAGVQLAEGGIVKARPGGIQATIGEGGQDEAVIPLDRAGEFMPRNNITLNVYGGLLGDQATARQLAMAIDSEMLKLRQNNESLSFDRGVI